MNNLADALLSFLMTKHARVYRNDVPQNVVYPYIVFILGTASDTHPSDDVSVNIYIYESKGTSVRAIETLADLIDAGLNLYTIDSVSINARFVKDLRQFVNDPELSGVKFINLQYTCRLYLK
jgi:hypothetical protein